MVKALLQQIRRVRGFKNIGSMRKEISREAEYKHAKQKLNSFALVQSRELLQLQFFTLDIKTLNRQQIATLSSYVGWSNPQSKT